MAEPIRADAMSEFIRYVEIRCRGGDASCTRAAVEMYAQLGECAEQPTALNRAITLAAFLVSESDKLCAAPDLKPESSYASLVSELGGAAALLYAPGGDGGARAQAYKKVCASIRELMAVAAHASPRWAAERRRLARGRAAPPPAGPVGPMADDNEYYALR